MNLTGGTRAAITVSAMTLLAGVLASAYGIVGHNIPHALAGLGLIVAASTSIALAVLRNWIVDTHDERRNLATKLLQAENEKSQYYTARADLENEMGCAARDIAKQRARNAASLVKEREALRAEFEANRLQQSQKAFLLGARMERAGQLKPDEPAPTNLIQFPQQQVVQEQGQEHPQAEPERTLPWEHGVSAP
jgi:hypothetical protein